MQHGEYQAGIGSSVARKTQEHCFWASRGIALRRKAMVSDTEAMRAITGWGRGAV